MDSHQSMLARSNLPCLPWAAPGQLRTATQLYASTSDTCEELKRKHCVKKGTFPQRLMYTVKACCLGPAMALSSLVWACILAVHSMGLIKTVLIFFLLLKKRRFTHQQPFKSFKSSKSFHSPCRHVGKLWKVCWQFALLKLVLRVLASLEFGITLMCRQLFALADLDAWTVVLKEWVADD